MKQKKVIGGIAIGLLLATVVVWLNFRDRRGAVRVSFGGYTNVNGIAMALFKVQNYQSRRIWLRDANYLLGEEFQEPRGGWQCPMKQAIASRWGKAPPELMVPQGYLPPEPTPTSPDPTEFMVPVPKDHELWRIGVTVEFNIGMPERIRVAWSTRNPRMLKKSNFINNSPDAIWVESPVITNLTAQSGTAAGSTGSQPRGLVVPLGSSNLLNEDRKR